MIFPINNIQFSIREQGDKFVAFRLMPNGHFKKYKLSFDTFEKVYAYCERMANLSNLYQEAKKIASLFGGKLVKWMYDKAKKAIEEAKDIFKFNSKLTYSR